MSISKSIKLFGSRLFTSLKSIEDLNTYVGYTYVYYIKILIEKKNKIKTESLKDRNLRELEEVALMRQKNWNKQGKKPKLE